MAWHIGIDEAGYGPNLGPLVVAVSVWWVEKEGGQAGKNAIDLYARLQGVVSPAPSNTHLAIADSKKLYKPGTGLRQLERGVLTTLRAGSSPTPVGTPATWTDLIKPHAPALACYSDYDCDLPIDTSCDEITDLTTRFTAACGLAGIHLAALRARLVYPREFNELTTHCGNKGAALSQVSIRLLREVMGGIEQGCSPDLRPGLVPSHQPPATSHYFATFDKHGGRNRYAALLQHFFPEVWIETLAESGPVSHYAWGSGASRVEVRFRSKGEAELPVALASMTAKYHRELAMRAFNDFWCREVPGLRPTAGYPLDAKRFKAQIAQRQQELDIADVDLWRER